MEDGNLESKLKLEFNLAFLYLLTNQNNKCFYYLGKININDFNKNLDKKRCRQIGLAHLKLANNYLTSNKKDFDKALASFKNAAEYFEKLDFSELDENDDSDFVIYCQILIAIAKHSPVSLIDSAYIDKICSVCKNLENEEIKGLLLI